MKYAVTVETEVDFEFFPHVDKDELLKEFCEYIFTTDMEGLERFIAERIALGDYGFIEGIGKISPAYRNCNWQDEAKEKNIVLQWKVLYSILETEKL